MPEGDFSAVRSSGLSVSSEISHGSPQSFCLDSTVAYSLPLPSRQIEADPRAVHQHMDAGADSPSLRDMLTGQEFVFELMLRWGLFIYFYKEEAQCDPGCEGF